MAKQTSIAPCLWGVGEATVEASDGKPMEVRALVMTEMDTGDAYVFPIPEEEAKILGEALQSDNPEEVTQKHRDKLKAEAELKVASRMPSPEEVLATQRMQGRNRPRR